MTTWQEAREYGESVLTVSVSETSARCPRCGVPSMRACWRKLRNGVDGARWMVWGECPECGEAVECGSRPAMSAMEAETLVVERAARKRWEAGA